MPVTIRKILPQDNAAIAKIIREVMIEHEVPKTGSAYEDPELDAMFEAYQQNQSVYFIASVNGEIVGGAGIAPLKNGEPDTCELQKMYILAKTRGLGVGKALMDACLQSATEMRFEQCYLETMPNMHAAQSLYKKSGFEYLEKPMGNTCHTACPVWMITKL